MIRDGWSRMDIDSVDHRAFESSETLLPGPVMVPSPGDPGKAALVAAHPGHELMVYHWMAQRRPLYFCLTDGSGGNAASRLASTTRLLDGVGARRGPLFGRYPDRE